MQTLLAVILGIVRLAIFGILLPITLVGILADIGGQKNFLAWWDIKVLSVIIPDDWKEQI